MGLQADAADRASVALVGKHDARRHVGPLLTPLPERHERRQQAFPLVGECVGDLAAVDRVRRPLEDAAADHFHEAVGKDVPGNAQTRLELLEVA